MPKSTKKKKRLSAPSYSETADPTLITPFALLETVRDLRALVISNSTRIPSFRQVADKLGSIETLIVEGSSSPPADPNQEKLPITDADQA